MLLHGKVIHKALLGYPNFQLSFHMFMMGYCKQMSWRVLDFKSRKSISQVSERLTRLMFFYFSLVNILVDPHSCQTWLAPRSYDYIQILISNKISKTVDMCTGIVFLNLSSKCIRTASASSSKSTKLIISADYLDSEARVTYMSCARLIWSDDYRQTKGVWVILWESVNVAREWSITVCID